MAKWLALSFSLKGAAKGRAGRWDLLRRAAGLKGEGPARIKAQHVRPASTGPTDRAGGASREAPPPHSGFTQGAQILGTKAGKEE